MSQEQVDWQSRPKVAVLVETSKEYGRGVLQGIVQYAKTKADWTIYFDERGLDDPAPPWFQSWQGDGILVRGRSRQMLDLAKESQACVVNLGETWDPDIPSVETDEYQIGVSAAEHLLQRGQQQFACYEIKGIEWSRRRAAAFVETIYNRSPHAKVQHFVLPPVRRMELDSWSQHFHIIHSQLSSLTTPIGIFACYDVIGVRIVQACRDIGLRVPEEVAILACDNDQMLCQLCDPTLSSIPHRTTEIGYTAARMLDTLMRGERLENIHEVVAPSAPLTRHSTEILAIDDLHVVQAIRFIRTRASKTVTPDQVASHCRLSRGYIEKRFKRAVGETISSYILSERLLRAKELLHTTDMKLWQIAEDTGFKHAEYFSVVFKREVGLTPKQFRDGFHNI